MPRRDIRRAKDGQVFCVEWPEWHVHCPVCGRTALVASIGGCSSVREAEAILKVGQQEDEGGQWKKINKLWYCPKCKDQVK
jgi:rubredoxin